MTERLRGPNRLEGPIDGALHLLDRQLVDRDGELLGKVDDVELTELDTGVTITALLTGHAALLPRLGPSLGGWLRDRWASLRVSEPRRTWPWRIPVELVDHLDSAVHLSVPRESVLVRDRQELRLGALTGMDVDSPTGRIGRVLDARFEPGPDGRPVLRSLIVGHGRPGSLLGYDRRGDQGPLLVRMVVRRLHRHSRVVAAEDATIRWDVGRVEVGSEPTESPGHAFDG